MNRYGFKVVGAIAIVFGVDLLVKATNTMGSGSWALYLGGFLILAGGFIMEAIGFLMPAAGRINTSGARKKQQ